MKKFLIMLLISLPVLHLDAQQPASTQLLVNQYLSIKDALVADDANAAAEYARTFLKTTEAAKAEALKKDAKAIADTKDIAKQRAAFARLSDQLYKMVKAGKTATTIYYQHCPMYNDGKGGNWLSKDKEVKNPFYGDMMLNCGRTVETIQ